MRISVVVATYNGEKYIKEQLESILLQTRKPDEVVIYDDCSADDTIGVIKRFIGDNQLSDTWHTLIQERNVGWKKNFYDATKAATGDIVFFSDQDDIWMPDKIEKMSGIMKEKKAGCVYGDYDFMDENGIKVPGADKRSKVAVVDNRELFNTIVTMGCRMCISRQVADIYLDIAVPEFSYDSQCGRLAYLYSDIVIIPDMVLKYRIHGNNTSGVGNQLEEGSLTLPQRIQEITDNIAWLKKLKDYDIREKQGDCAGLIGSVIEFQQNRLGYLKGNCRLSKIDKRYYRDRTMVIGDIAYKYRMNRLLGGIKRVIAGGFG